ncbi:MAG: type II toxin-antitoxin system VapC family toxin [Candidatus Dormibacteraceae bacterium]
MILVDTDILIWHLRGLPQARDWLRDQRQETAALAISSVTLAEVAGAMRSAERRPVTRFLSSLAVLPVTMREAWQAAEFRRRFHRSHQTIGLADYLIAATAWTEGLELATLNVKHFPMFGGLTQPFTIAS